MTTSIRIDCGCRAPGAERLAQAGLPRASGYRDQHDVHDAGAADHERHRGDRSQKQGGRPGRYRLRLHGGGGLAHLEVIVRIRSEAVALAQNLLDLLLHRGQGLRLFVRLDPRL